MDLLAFSKRVAHDDRASSSCAFVSDDARNPGTARRRSVPLCDEPDASVDPALADRLVSDLLAAAGYRGVVLVTHRLESVAGVDEVVVVNDGRVGQRRTHDELLAMPGWYSERWLDPSAASVVRL